MVDGGSEHQEQEGNTAWQETNSKVYRASVNPEAPPDGGCRAYVVVVASFCTNGLIFGIMNSYSVIYLVLLKRLQSQNVDLAEVKACK